MELPHGRNFWLRVPGAQLELVLKDFANMLTALACSLDPTGGQAGCEEDDFHQHIKLSRKVSLLVRENLLESHFWTT